MLDYAAAARAEAVSLQSAAAQGMSAQSIPAVSQPTGLWQAHILLFLAKGCVVWRMS
jgi:hypothetical protein